MRYLLQMLLLAVLAAAGVVGWTLFTQDDTGRPGRLTGVSRTPERTKEARDEVLPTGEEGSIRTHGAVEGPSRATAEIGQARRAFPDPLGGPRRVRLEGHVMDAGGDPVSGARVRIFENLSRLMHRPLAASLVAALETDEAGGFSHAFDVGLGSTFVLRITHEAHPPRWVPGVDPLRPATLRQEIRLDEGRVVRGSVRDGEGLPVPGARVSIVDLEAPVPPENEVVEREGVTDGAGEFALPAVSFGRKRLLVRARGYALAFVEPVPVMAGRDLPPLRLTLERGGTLRGEVRDAVTGAGIPGARVVLKPVSRGRRPRVHPGDACESDGDGSFVFEGLPDGLFSLRAEAAGYAASRVVNARAGDDQVVLRLQAVATIRGYVLGSDGLPPPLCGVTWGRTPDPAAASWALQARVDAGDGGFELDSVPVGVVYLFARAPGYGGARAGPFELESGQRLDEVELQLEKGAVITGFVQDDQGAPLGGVPVTLLRRVVLPKRKNAEHLKIKLARPHVISPQREVTTFADGSFLVIAYEPGWYALRVAGGGRYAVHETEMFEASSGQEISLPPIQLRRAAAIEGVVLAGDGRPDDQALVAVLPVGGKGPRQSVPTRRDGRFRVDGLPPGRFQVLVVKRRGVVLTGRISGGGRKNAGVLVDLGPGDVSRLELREGGR